VAQLEDTVTKLYNDLPAVLPASPHTMHSSMKTKRDEPHGEFVEILSTTPLGRQTSSAAALVWRNFTLHYLCAVGPTRSVSSSCACSVEAMGGVTLCFVDVAAGHPVEPIASNFTGQELDMPPGERA
jgi:hypothetical protein